MLCPRCQKGDMVMSLAGIKCSACGYDLYADMDHIPGNEPDWDPAEFNRQQAAHGAEPVPAPIKPPPESPPPEPARTEPAPDVIPIDLPPTIYRHEVPGLSDRALARFEGFCLDASAALADGRRDEARAALHRALELSTNSDQVWLFLAGLALTREEQREALEQALACNTGNLIAMEALARLRGDLDQAASLRAESGGAQGKPGQIEVSCPNCGGALVFSTDEQAVKCYHCGHEILDVKALQRGVGPLPLPIGLLRRKNAPQEWNIGGRWLHCRSCGASLTVSRLTLSTTCRFCGSQQVMVESIGYRFEQPDDIVPFEIDQATAQAAVEEYLTTGLRRVTRLFADPVSRIELQGIYLPVWVIDAEMRINWSWTAAPARGQHPVLVGDVLWPATPSVPRSLFFAIEPFDLVRGKQYDPRLLAVFPAELYQDDIDRASLDVRPRLKALAERQAFPSLSASRPAGQSNGWGSKNEGPGRLVMNTQTHFMSYRLALVPVWVGRLTEDDGDQQPVVVNGQTGEVALGRVEKNGVTGSRTNRDLSI